MLTKIIVLIAMILILYSLGSSMYYLLNDKGESTRAVKALTWRVSLSLGLFVFLLVSFHFGWLHPHGLG